MTYEKYSLAQLEAERVHLLHCMEIAQERVTFLKLEIERLDDVLNRRKVVENGNENGASGTRPPSAGSGL